MEAGPSTKRESNTARPAALKAIALLTYFALYLCYLLLFPENEFMHWLSLVALPLLMLAALDKGEGGFTRAALWRNVRFSRPAPRGILAALALGGAFCALQLFGKNSGEIRDVFATGRASYLWPLALLLMVLTAASTEEIFFRGLLQANVQSSTGSKLIGGGVATLAFALYHVPYALARPGWGTQGEWGASMGAAFETGIPLGMLLGGLYVYTRGCLTSCILGHALINSLPAMALVQRLISRN